MFVAENNGHPGTFGGADNLFANAPFAQLPEFFLFRVLHGICATDFAVVLKMLLDGLAFFANDFLVRVFDAFTFIRFRRIETT